MTNSDDHTLFPKYGLGEIVVPFIEFFVTVNPEAVRNSLKASRIAHMIDALEREIILGTGLFRPDGHSIAAVMKFLQKHHHQIEHLTSQLLGGQKLQPADISFFQEFDLTLLSEVNSHPDWFK